MKDKTAQNDNSYRQILKSTTLVGGSSFIKMLIGMVRTKFVAVLIGPAGIGLIGMYGAITSIIGIISGMGLGVSGVRQIAESIGTGDEERIARTVKTLRRTVWFTGLLGMFVTMAGSIWWSKITFGTSKQAIAIALLGITIIMGSISTGQSCIIQGARRISDLAKMSIIGAITGTVISIPCFYFWTIDGIVPSLLLTSAAGLITSWWFARRITIRQINLPWHESREEVCRLMIFGIPLMLSSVGGALTLYVINMILIRQTGLEGVGIYLAAFGLSGIVVNFVLVAMGTDYYPRLTAIAYDNRKIAHEVNVQTEISLLLGTPCLAATLIFAPVIIPFFYSGKFDAAVDILRWLIFGVFGKIVLFPIGYVILAKGRSKITLWAEAINDSIWVLLTWVCVKQWGLKGSGIAFALLYIFATGLFLMITYSIANTKWTRSNILHIIGTGTILIIISLNCYFFSFWLQWIINLMLLVSLSIYCLHRLSVKSGLTLQNFLNKLLSN